MTKLLHAGFYRLKKNKVLGGCLLAIITYELFSPPLNTTP